MDIILAWRNIWRNPRRSILTMSAVAFTTLLLIFMLSWQFGSYTAMIDASVKIQTGHIQIQSEAYADNRDIRETIDAPDQIGRFLLRIPEITAYTFRAEGFSLTSSEARTQGVLMVGIDPEREASVSTIRHKVRKGAYLTASDQGEVLIGHLLAKNLKTEIGGELVVLGQGRDGSIAAAVLRVKGIFDSGQDDFDRNIAYMPLSYFQEIYSMNHGVNSIVIICETLKSIPEVKSRIQQFLNSNENLAVLDWQELNPGLSQAIKMDLVSGFLFYLILIVVVAFSILNTFLMAIFERTREFGVMMAMGVRPGRLMGILLMESVGMTVMGAIAGIAAGSLLTWYYQIHGILIPGMEEFARQFGIPERIHPELSLLSIFLGTGIVLALTLITAVYPAFKVKRLKPVKALAGG